MEDLKIDDSERTICECWTRVIGYLRPTSQYNKGKKAEFDERTPFLEEKIKKTIDL
jgi:anaerobic ribonucleoside-triphosphate reductase